MKKLAILDIGCGTGYRTHVLSKRKHAHVFGVDLDDENIQLAKRRYPHVTFKRMNADKLAFTNKYFDEIYAVDVLEHVDNLESVLAEIARVSKKGAKLVIIVPDHRSERWLLSLRPTYHEEIHHVRIFKRDDLIRILKRYNFELKVHQPQNFIQHIEFYYFFKIAPMSASQLAIGDWRSNYASMFVHAFISSFDPYWVFNTPLKFIPIWIVTLPLGFVGNFFGNKIMPKSNYYEFTKER